MEEDYSSEKDDQEEDYVEMYEPSLALLDIYMERLTLKDDDEDMVDADLILVPPENVMESDDEQMEAEEPEQRPDVIDPNPAQVALQSKYFSLANAVLIINLDLTLENYPKKRIWTQPENIELPAFREFSQPTEEIFTGFNPVQFFELFFDEQVYNHILVESIAYADDPDFNLSIKELKAFVGILLLSGYLDVPRWRMFWEVGSESFNQLVSSAMRRNRFEEIKRRIHLADNTSLDKADKFAKVRPLFDLLNERYRRFAPLEENLCVDESICPYFGRHSAKQFIRGKPIRLVFYYLLYYLLRNYAFLGSDSNTGRCVQDSVILSNSTHIKERVMNGTQPSALADLL